MTGNAVSNARIGDGVCNDDLNTAECNFDGGDCCGHCETMTVALDNNARAAQGNLEGIYYNSSIVNGKPSWTSTSQAIWYDQNYDNWKISSLDDIGSSKAGIKSDNGFGCPFDLPSKMWNYFDSVWTTMGTNEMNISCLNGNYL